jgi:hypothetical protein
MYLPTTCVIGLIVPRALRFIFFFNFLVKKFYFRSTLSRVFKPTTRLKLVSRGENAVRVDAVKGSEPRTPELEIPRPSAGARVGEWGSSKLVSTWERLQPLLYITPTGRPPLVKGGIVGGVEKREGTTPGRAGEFGRLELIELTKID